MNRGWEQSHGEPDLSGRKRATETRLPTLVVGKDEKVR